MAPGKQTLSAADYEVIVSDDGQDYPAESYCRENFPWVRYTRGPRKGPAANRNNGARMAFSDWLVFLDDDCIPDYSILENYSLAIKDNPACKIFEGRISPIGEQTAFNQECPINETGGHLWSCNFCVERNLFHSIGGFDENFLYAAMEDIDICHRVEATGKIIFCTHAKVGHPWKTIDSPFERFKMAYFSHLVYLQKWPNEKKRFRFTKQFRKVVYHIIHFLIPNLFRFKVSGISYVLAYYHFMFRMAFLQFKRDVF